MRGLIMYRGYQRGWSPPPGRGGRSGPVGAAVERVAHDRGELVDGVLEAIVDDHVAELVLGVELRLGRAQARVDLLGVVRAAAHEPRAQRLARRGRDEHLERLGHRLAHLPGALDLDLEHDRLAGAQPPLELGTQRAVPAAGVGGVLDELARVDAALEIRVVEEVVVDAVLLARPRAARGRRDAEAELRHALAQRPDQGALADARGTGDDEDARHGRDGASAAREAACGYRRKSETSSLRWRCERPPIVLLGEIRHCWRTLLTFTRPYFGTARSMSKTLAVWRYSGGSSSRVWIETRPPFRSFFSCARRVRISFARWRASMRWRRERSGAAEC